MITWRVVREIKPGLIDEYNMDVNRFEMARDCLWVIVVSCMCSETLGHAVRDVCSISNSNQLAGTVNSAKFNSDSGRYEHTSNTRLIIQSPKCNRLSYAADLEWRHMFCPWVFLGGRDLIFAELASINTYITPIRTCSTLAIDESCGEMGRKRIR